MKEENFLNSICLVDKRESPKAEYHPVMDFKISSTKSIFLCSNHYIRYGDPIKMVFGMCLNFNFRLQEINIFLKIITNFKTIHTHTRIHVYI